MEALPKLRIELDAVECNDGSGMFLLYDRSGLSKAQLMLSPEVMFVISCLDGNKSELELQNIIEEKTGLKPQISELDTIINNLDTALFLDNKNFADYFTQLQLDFFNQSCRKMVCAGSAYPADKEILDYELAQMINSAPPAFEEGRVTNAVRPAPRGVIVPHMDFGRAREAYGQLYGELKKYQPPEAVLIIGTAHQSLKNRFAICNKDFEIPDGVVESHKPLINELIERCQGEIDLCADMFAHRFEHSIELQAVWLNHIWGSAIKIIPLLVGSLDDFLISPQQALHDNNLCTLINAVHDMLPGRKIMLMASADLSHIGPRFGDERNIDVKFLEETKKADLEYLQLVKTGNALGALENLACHNDKFHICGTGCIYVLNSIMPQVSGRLLGYYQCVTEQLRQAVTCASMVFEY